MAVPDYAIGTTPAAPYDQVVTRVEAGAQGRGLRRDERDRCAGGAQGEARRRSAAAHP